MGVPVGDNDKATMLNYVLMLIKMVFTHLLQFHNEKIKMSPSTFDTSR